MTCKDCVYCNLCKFYEDNTINCNQFQSKTDFVNVIRCKDCRRCHKRITKRNKQTMYFCMRMDGNEFQVNANDYCSYGRKDNK